MKQTKIDKLNPNVMSEDKIKQATWIEDAMWAADFGPVVIYCDDNEWEKSFGEYTLIDATSIKKEDLFGTDYNNRSYFCPMWLKDAQRTKSIVITNFAKVSEMSDRDQYDFAHLLRDSGERLEYRELNFESGIYVPQDVKTFLILKHGESLNQFYTSRCSIIDLKNYDK